MIRTIHRAKYVLSETDTLLQDAAVHVSDQGRISRIEPSRSGSPGRQVRVLDWGSAVLMPGFVNSHTHLELSLLGGTAGKPSSFADWLGWVFSRRRDLTPEQFRESALAGAVLALQSGTTLIGDISSSGESKRALQPLGIRRVVFEESLALDPARADEAVREVDRRLTQVVPDAVLASGLSPHAPYSVSAKLYRDLAAMAQHRTIPLATHVAESPEEIEFLESGTGHIREFLTGIGAMPDGWIPPRLDPIAYLEVLGILDRAPLLIHCNYLDANSMITIHRKRCSVVYCPRSNAFFGHEEHPVRQLLDLGVNVALGTDSLASNESLSMLDEMRFLYRERRDLRCGEIFRMATLNGAAALGFGGISGRLRRGHWADMAVLQLPEDMGDRNLPAQILEGAGECIATIVGGEIVWQRNNRSGSNTP